MTLQRSSRHACALLTIMFLLAPVSLCVSDDGGAVTISTAEQIKQDFDSVPCKKNADRLNAVRLLLEKMGALESDITVQKFDRVENLAVRKQGSGEGMIVIGAHYDKTSDGCGAIDNWTGIVTLAHLYRSLNKLPLKKSILFVAFGKEEEGLIGSKAMVKAIDKDAVKQYCAMINIDSLGMGAPQVATNISTKKILDRATDIAKRMQMPFAAGVMEEGNSDSSSFIAKKIPAITIHALAGDWIHILHSTKDQASIVKTESVYLGYRLALSLAIDLDNNDCDAWR
jgi:putative aminopeptidase FrvX